MNEKMSINDLNSGFIKPELSGLTSDEQLNAKKKMIQDEYNFYLKRYINSYSQLQILKSQQKDPAFQNRLKNIVDRLSIKMTNLMNQINGDLSKSKILKKTNQQEIARQNMNINVNSKNQEVLNKLIVEKNTENVSQTKKIADSKELVNHIRFIRDIYIVLTVIFLLVLFYLSLKFSISETTSVFSINLDWLSN
jgi:transketolase